MSPEDVKYYEAQIDMFAGDGWRAFISNVRDIIASNKNSVFDIRESNDFFEAKGVMKTLVWLDQYENICRMTLEGSDNADV